MIPINSATKLVKTILLDLNIKTSFQIDVININYTILKGCKRERRKFYIKFTKLKYY
ncbi:hypothetical protein SKB0123_18010 [Staphylococcus capitis]|nr:hypothetical protein GCM10008141_08140 [Staphylococcus capitis]